ncbi:MAG: transglycosylase [Betaproteobacteria bacterium RBG_16_56_24]|nr:MAG: transglycosylase [Betaproteobacteria bacterium RBG_16_56_24]
MRFILYLLLLVAAPALADQDADFLAARDAYRAGNPGKLERYAQRLKDSPLEVYVSYYLLQLDLKRADTRVAPSKVEAAVKEFLARPEDTPVIGLLRAEWLKLLGKRQQWDSFDAEYPFLVNDDPELTCYALQSMRRKDEQVALLEARRLWFSGKGQPESCAVLFEDALSAGIIVEEDVKQRLRLALEAGNVSLAQQLIVRLEGNNSAMSAALKRAAADADGYLRKPPQDILIDERQRVIALFALQRLAKQSPELAFARWEKISFHFTEDEKHYFFGWLGYEAARNLDGRALQWYKAAASAPLNEQQMVWRIRAALRAQDWTEVSAGIDAMNPQQQQEPAWQYWKARALQELQMAIAARQIFVSLSGKYSFYGQLAAEELAGSPVLSETAPTYKPDDQAIAEMKALPGVQRTMALYRMGLRTEALEEWRWLVHHLNDHELLTAAEIARRNEMYDRAIGAADETVSVHDFSLRYLAPYRDVLQAHIREHGLDEAWVYGVMRQESRFVTGAKSEAGAAGLMQIMPATARWMAQRLGLKSYRKALIHQLDTNLRLGTYYMKTVLSQSDNNPVLASASYNAGPTRARQWRGDQPLEGAIYTETIPYEETRDYVKKVMSNTYYYANQFGDAMHSLKQRLGIVAGKSASKPTASAAGKPSDVLPSVTTGDTAQDAQSVPSSEP